MQKPSYAIMFSLVLLAILTNCNPPQPTPNNTYCLIKKANVNGANSMSIVFDSQHRVIRSLFQSQYGNSTSFFIYSPNQIERIDSNDVVLMSKTYYTLDANSRATKSICEHYGSIPFNPNPGSIDTAYYTYNNNGFLISTLRTWEHHNAPTPYYSFDTISYKIENENVVEYKRINKGLKDSVGYEYSTYPNTFNELDIIYGTPLPIHTLFGKKNKHLLSKIKESGYSAAIFTYTFDNAGLATQYQVSQDSTIYTIDNITYECL